MNPQFGKHLIHAMTDLIMEKKMQNTKQIEERIEKAQKELAAAQAELKQLQQPEVKLGQVWKSSVGTRIIVNTHDAYHAIDLSGMSQDNTKRINDLYCVRDGKLIANSLEEYYQLKQEGKV